MSQMMRLITIAAVMTAFLISIVIGHALRRAGGTEVILDLEPIDPRDLFAGYYVIINTPAHSLDLVELEGDNVFASGADVFTSLSQNEHGEWVITGVFRQRPEAGTYLHGKAQNTADASEDQASFNDTLRVRYNIERYYADQATASELEDIRRSNSSAMRLIISVGRDGQAIIRGLEIEGERVIAPFI